MNISFDKYFSYGKINRKIPKEIHERLIAKMGDNFPEESRYPYRKQIGIHIYFRWIGFKNYSPVVKWYHFRNRPIRFRFSTDRRLIFLKENGKWEPALRLGFVGWEVMEMAVMNTQGITRMTFEG